MSWTQGIQPREELPENFVQFFEKKYLEMFGEVAQVQYITWDACDPEQECIVDFGTEHSIRIKSWQ